jgi:TP901 family phage tail tape measure protein
MALEAQEIAVRVRLLGGAAFKTEADGVARSVEGIGAAGKTADISTPISKSGNALSTLGSKASKVGSAMIGVGRTMTMAGVPIAAVGYYAVKASTQFQQAMTLLVTQAGMAKKSLGPMSTAVESIASKYGSTPTAMADALYPIESIGLRGAAAMNALKASAIGTAVGLDSLSNTSDAVTTIMASHIKGSGGPVEAMSIMDKAIGLGKMHLADLTESFKSGIVPISQMFGLSFKQIVSAASGLTRVGIPANQVMNRMRLTLTSMISPTAAGLKAMSAMGITQFQLADDLRKPGGLLTALKDLKTHADAIGNTDLSNSYIAQMFGKSRGMASIGSLLNQLPQIDQIYGKVMATTPATLDQHYAETKATAAFKYKQIQAALDVAMIKLGGAINQFLLPVLAQLVPLLTGAVQWFGALPGGVKKFLLVLAAAVVVGGPIFMFAGALIKTGSAVLSAGGWLVTQFRALAVASDTAAGSEGGLGLAGFARGLGRVIPMLGLFAVALHALPGMANAAKKQLNATVNSLTGHTGTNIANGYQPGLGAFGTPRVGKPSVGGFLGNAKNTLHELLGWIPGLHGLASGGTVLSAGLTLVGEAGPELLNLPRGARVSPNLGPSGFNSPLQNTTFPGMPGGGGGNETTVVQVVLDGKVVAESVNNRNRKTQNRR